MYQRVAPTASKLTVDANSITIEVKPKAGAATTFDLYDGKNVVQSGVASPIKVTGLIPNKQYDNYALAYAGKADKTALSFKTKAQPVTGVSLDKTVLSLETGKTATLKPTVAPKDATDKAIEFSSSNEAVAIVGKKDGKVTAIKAGTADITVVTHEEAKKDTAKVTVKDPVVNVTGISLDQTEISVEEGATAQLKATVAPPNATNKKVTWKSGNPETFTIDANGKINGVKAGQATAVATTDDGKNAAEARVTVKGKKSEPDTEPEEPTESATPDEP